MKPVTIVEVSSIEPPATLLDVVVTTPFDPRPAASRIRALVVISPVTAIVAPLIPLTAPPIGRLATPVVAGLVAASLVIPSIAAIKWALIPTLTASLIPALAASFVPTFTAALIPTLATSLAPLYPLAPRAARNGDHRVVHLDRHRGDPPGARRAVHSH
jgi:hypothetical protein